MESVCPLTDKLLMCLSVIDSKSGQERLIWKMGYAVIESFLSLKIPQEEICSLLRQIVTSRSVAFVQHEAATMSHSTQVSKILILTRRPSIDTPSMEFYAGYLTAPAACNI